MAGMIWTPYDCLNKFYSFYMTAVLYIVSRCVLSINAGCRNQPNYYYCIISYFHFNSDLRQLYIMSNKMDHFSYKGVAMWCMVYVGIHILRHLKEELAWVIDKWLWMISNIGS